MLAVWRVHGFDAILREAWEAGVLLCGWSAGMICWFEAGITDSFGPQLEGMSDGLGFLPGSACPHYDGEEWRRPVYTRLVGEGFPPGIALDDGVAAHYAGPSCRGRRPTPRSERLPRGAERRGIAGRSPPHLVMIPGPGGRPFQSRGVKLDAQTCLPAVLVAATVAVTSASAGAPDPSGAARAGAHSEWCRHGASAMATQWMNGAHPRDLRLRQALQPRRADADDEHDVHDLLGAVELVPGFPSGYSTP